MYLSIRPFSRAEPSMQVITSTSRTLHVTRVTVGRNENSRILVGGDIIERFARQSARGSGNDVISNAPWRARMVMLFLGHNLALQHTG